MHRIEGRDLGWEQQETDREDTQVDDEIRDSNEQLHGKCNGSRWNLECFRNIDNLVSTTQACFLV